MGLGTSTREKALYLSIAGGYIWDRKADKSNPNYGTQIYLNQKKEEIERAGAKYDDLTGHIYKVEFRRHAEYGESLNVTVESEGDKFILSISTKNKNAQDFMKALLLMDLSKKVLINPYDFTNKESKKRTQGTSFSQDGTKFNLWDLKLPEEFDKSDDKAFFAQSNAKLRNRYFEDLSDYFVSEIEEKIIPALDKANGVEESKNEATEEIAEAKVETETKAETVAEVKTETKAVENKTVLTPMKMKKFLKSYIVEEYPTETLPNLSKEEIIEWYNLAVSSEELPFVKAEETTDSVEEEDDEALKDEIAALVG